MGLRGCRGRRQHILQWSFGVFVGCAGDGKNHEVGALDPLSSSKDSILKGVLLSEDLSNGLEKVPIRCVMDGDAVEPCSCSLCTEGGSLTSPRDSQPWNNFVYTTKRHLDPSLGLDTKVCVWSPCVCFRECLFLGLEYSEDFVVF